MVDTIAGINIARWAVKNEIDPDDLDFVGMVKHKTQQLNYGGLFKSTKGLIFHKHKWQEVNKNKTAPKVCAETVYTAKFVDEGIWDYYELLSEDDYYEIYKKDMNSIN